MQLIGCLFKNVIFVYKGKEKGRAEDALILDSYIPADGCYISVNSDGIIACQMDLKFNKKAKQMEGISQRYYGKMCFFDYHSRLVSMDKPVDPKKVIHSNNYLSFWVKQESLGNGKLNQEAIDRYFDVLKNPEKKYAKSKDRQMYDYIAAQIDEINVEKLEWCRDWVKKHIFSLEDMGISLSGKNYLKIFFEDTEERYIQEEQRYHFYLPVHHSLQYIPYKARKPSLPSDLCFPDCLRIYLRR